MTLAIVAEPAPLEVNTDGVAQVGKTRVTLDTVVAVFQHRATAEEIVYRYSSLKLANVYATITSTSTISKKLKRIYSNGNRDRRKFVG